MMKVIQLETVLSRVFLVAVCFLFLTVTFFFIKWCVGDVIAARAPTREVAELSIGLAPNDPQTHYALAVLNGKNYSPEDLAKSLVEYERAVALSPQDYRLWLAYGKARERGGDGAGAEFALKKAVEFAPSYAPVRWAYGNVVLRRGRIEEGFSEMIRAAENDKNYRSPVIATAWQIFDGDLKAVRQRLGDSANINSALASFLAKRKLFEEAIRIWNGLSAEEKKTVYKSDGEQIFGELLAAKKFRTALQIQQSYNDDPDTESFAVGKIFNGGFELDDQRKRGGSFDWQIADGIQPQIGPNNEQTRSGEWSIFIIFNSLDGKDFRQMSQTVAVESSKKYTFETFYKAELKTAATLRWEVVDASDGKVLASTDAISADANWTGLTAEFTTTADTEAVTLRLARARCRSIICPIAGKVRFDDFSLKE